MNDVYLNLGANVYVFHFCILGLIRSCAGSDTTSISLRAILYYLCKNPSTMRKLQKEIEDMESKGTISDPVAYQQSCSMPYLQAVLKEAMRQRSPRR
jgi:cytochrome P450